MALTESPSAAPLPTAGVRILLVEDEPGIAGFVRRGLIFEGFVVEVAVDGRTALYSLRDRPPDLLVLDVMLPELDGIELTRRLRAAEAAEDRPALPILMLTARETVADRVAGLEAGADDYLVKPFEFDELLARVRALLRRTRAATAEPTELLHFDDLTLDPATRTVMRGTRPFTLTPREFDLVALFLRHPNQVLTRTMLMQRVWGEDFFGESNVLEVIVGNVRRVMEANGEPRLIHTVRGVGYVLRESY